MEIKKVWAVYFSATGTTQKVVEAVADTIAAEIGAEVGSIDFTLPGARAGALAFNADELVVFGTPVVAGRVPNVLLKYLDTISGGGALAVPVVLFGNRDYDDALVELRDILERGGLHTIAAAAFVGEHSF
ncbi:MAG: flavodoxin family protein, partial [Clostridiales bacterium]|nr:flavodoxin family protein [Clostridiales bacterium]